MGQWVKINEPLEDVDSVLVQYSQLSFNVENANIENGEDLEDNKEADRMRLEKYCQCFVAIILKRFYRID